MHSGWSRNAHLSTMHIVVLDAGHTQSQDHRHCSGCRADLPPRFDLPPRVLCHAYLTLGLCMHPHTVLLRLRSAALVSMESGLSSEAASAPASPSQIVHRQGPCEQFSAHSSTALSSTLTAVEVEHKEPHGHEHASPLWRRRQLHELMKSAPTSTPCHTAVEQRRSAAGIEDGCAANRTMILSSIFSTSTTAFLQTVALRSAAATTLLRPRAAPQDAAAQPATPTAAFRGPSLSRCPPVCCSCSCSLLDRRVS
jgi:hypothetical protein